MFLSCTKSRIGQTVPYQLAGQLAQGVPAFAASQSCAAIPRYQETAPIERSMKLARYNVRVLSDLCCGATISHASD